MFKVRDSGFPALAPLLPHYPPASMDCPLKWEPRLWDLQSMRNRLGLNVPMSLRFCDVELIREPYDRQRKSPVIAYLEEVHQLKKITLGAIYTDPYGRDAPEARAPPVMPFAPWETARDHRGKKQMERTLRLSELCDLGPLPTSQQLTMMAQRRAKDLGLEKSAKGGHELGPGRKPGHTSHHLYQPKPKKVISEWTVNFEMTKAMQRRRALDNKLVEACEEHGRHGQSVRLLKQEKDSKRVAAILTNLFKQRELKSKIHDPDKITQDHETPVKTTHDLEKCVNTTQDLQVQKDPDTITQDSGNSEDYV